MNGRNKKIKALVLLSGGLDSTLVLHMAKEQGLEPICVHFITPFCTCNTASGNRNFASLSTEKLDLEFMNVAMRQDYLNMVANPPHGYGKNMNPCIDCRIHKFKRAKEIMREKGASFIITGEVVGQRPMSQNRSAMVTIEKESGLEGFVLRPLSAGVLEPTVPEEKGWVDRDRLLSITGRSRKKHKKLIEKYGIREGEYSSPAGGCRLTNIEYSNKVRDIIDCKGSLEMEDVRLLNLGRHFRLEKNFKLIVGRNESENNSLDRKSDKKYLKMNAAQYKGPLCIGDGDADKKNIKMSAAICGFYAKCPPDSESEFNWQAADNSGKIKAEPLSRRDLEKYRI